MQNGLPFKFIHNRHRNYRDVMAVSTSPYISAGHRELQRIVFAIPQKINTKKVSQKPIRTNANSSALLRFPHFIKLMAEFELSLCSRCMYGKNVREFANFFFLYIYFIFRSGIIFITHMENIMIYTRGENLL